MIRTYTASGIHADNPAVKAIDDKYYDSDIESSNGVLSVEIKAYGDAPNVPLITVWALQEHIALKAYRRAHMLNIDHLFEEPSVSGNINE